MKKFPPIYFFILVTYIFFCHEKVFAASNKCISWGTGDIEGSHFWDKSSKKEILNCLSFYYKKEIAFERKKIQKYLKKYNLYSGNIDGIWGKNTAEAIWKYLEIIKKFPLPDTYSFLFAVISRSSPHEYLIWKKNNASMDKNKNINNTLDSCFNNLSECSDYLICVYATVSTSSGDKVWDVSKTTYVNAAKERNLTCNVKNDLFASLSLYERCSLNPKLCSDYEVCDIASQYSSRGKVWSSLNNEHVMEAQNRNLNCGIKLDSNEIAYELNDHKVQHDLLDDVIFKANNQKEEIFSDIKQNIHLKNKRVALLVGNSNYQSNPLKNPSNDIRLLEKTLKKTGFEVITETDVSRKKFRKALNEFRNKLNSYGESTDALFYYSGHGMQYEGNNYLIPLKSDIETEYDLDDESISSNRILSAMASVSSGVKIILLDACRDNNFRSFVRSNKKGLALMTAETGTIIGYATGPGKVAFDGDGNYSPFAKALAESIENPGHTIERVLKETRKMVVEETNGRQTPWTSSSLTGDFYFIPVN